jgi:hypothetical protein
VFARFSTRCYPADAEGVPYTTGNFTNLSNEGSRPLKVTVCVNKDMQWIYTFVSPNLFKILSCFLPLAVPTRSTRNDAKTHELYAEKVK